MFSFDDLPFHGLDVGLHPLGAVLELVHVLVPTGLVLQTQNNHCMGQLAKSCIFDQSSGSRMFSFAFSSDTFDLKKHLGNIPQ